MEETVNNNTAKAYGITEMDGKFCVFQVNFDPSGETAQIVKVSEHPIKSEAMEKFKIEVANNLF